MKSGEPFPETATKACTGYAHRASMPPLRPAAKGTRVPDQRTLPAANASSGHGLSCQDGRDP